MTFTRDAAWENHQHQHKMVGKSVNSSRRTGGE